MSKVSINESTLTSIGEAIRAKTGKSELIAPLDMPDEINAIQTGGGADLPEEVFNITGSCDYRFYMGNWDWFIRDYGNRITTSNIISALYMFSNAKQITRIPFTLNFKQDGAITLNRIFDCMYVLDTPPTLSTVKPSDLSYMFSNCRAIQRFPEDYGNNIDWSHLESLTSSYSGGMAYMFTSCYCLRKIPMNLIKSGNPAISYTYNYFYHGFANCYVLDELVDMPVPGVKGSWTSNGFYNSVQQCNRLKHFTFAKNPDGSPVVVKWKGQIIDLTPSVGYSMSDGYILSYGSDITADKRVRDDATYQALKNDNDWWTTNIAYSRYNHDSAVETINSLPDTSAYLASGGTNTIKFKGAAGELTDGGAINTLTEEEIAVAAAKGWTVSFA